MIERICEKLMGRTAYLRYKGASIGNQCEILTSANNFGSEPWLIEIGNNVTITDGVKLITHDASTRLFRHRHTQMNHRFGNKFGKIKIESNVFIGVNAIILPGVTIHNNSIIGAGSVVTKDIPPNTVYAGNPAKYKSTLEEYELKCVANLVEIRAQTAKELRKELTKDTSATK